MTIFHLFSTIVCYELVVVLLWCLSLVHLLQETNDRLCLKGPVYLFRSATHRDDKIRETWTRVSRYRWKLGIIVVRVTVIEQRLCLDIYFPELLIFFLQNLLGGWAVAEFLYTACQNGKRYSRRRDRPSHWGVVRGVDYVNILRGGRTIIEW